jgi:hypothetical protein
MKILPPETLALMGRPPRGGPSVLTVAQPRRTELMGIDEIRLRGWTHDWQSFTGQVERGGAAVGSLPARLLVYMAWSACWRASVAWSPARARWVPMPPPMVAVLPWMRWGSALSNPQLDRATWTEWSLAARQADLSRGAG